MNSPAQNDPSTETEIDDVTQDSEMLDALKEAQEAGIAPEAEAEAEAAEPEIIEIDKNQLQLLKEENESLVAQAAAAKDQALRAIAEAENTRRRAERDTEEGRKFALTGFARDLASVVDNLGRAVESIPAEEMESNPTLKNLGMGVEMTHSELLRVLERHGVQRVMPEVGELFDHNKHQAVVQIENDAYPAGSVLQVMQAGYTIHGRLLQPAMVGVSKLSPEAVEAQKSAVEDTPHIDTKA